MDAATKAKLKAYQQAKRAKARLLKDVPPDVLYLLADDYIDSNPDGRPGNEGWCYLKRATDEQVDAMVQAVWVVEAMAGVAPLVRTATIRGWRFTSVRKVMPWRIVYHILSQVVAEPNKYITHVLPNDSRITYEADA
jgi:hypothetical protein